MPFKSIVSFLMRSGCSGIFMLCKNFTVKRPVGSILDILATGISLTLSAAVAEAEAEAFYFLFLLSNANSV